MVLFCMPSASARIVGISRVPKVKNVKMIPKVSPISANALTIKALVAARQAEGRSAA